MIFKFCEVGGVTVIFSGNEFHLDTILYRYYAKEICECSDAVNLHKKQYPFIMR